MLRRSRRLLAPAWQVAASVVVLSTVLTGCVADTEPSVTPAPRSGASEAPDATSAPPTAPELVPDGTAAANLPYFTHVTHQVWAGADKASGRAYVDALASGGFDKTAMQVTSDTTTLGNPVESLQFSVLWAGECLVGQVGPETGDPVTVVLPAIEESRCLVGETRTIDW